MPSDLDVAGDATLEPPLTHGCGAGFYAAPEVLLKKAYGLPVDVWALGVIWRELVTGSCQKWITPPMSLPLPSESGWLAQRLKMCTLLAGPMNDETLPGCERLPNWKACAAAQCQLGNTKRLPWPQHLTKLQTAMRPLIETALHLQPELRATAGQLKMKITELPCEFVPRPVMVASPKLGSSGWAGSAANDAVSGDQTMTLVTSGEEALAGSAVTVSGDPSTMRCQCDGDGRYCTAKGHRKIKNGDNATRQCTSTVLPGMRFCSECICQEPGCRNRRHKCNHCREHWHLSDRVGVQLRALRVFQKEHAEMMPVDLKAFMDLPPLLPFSLLWVLAQLWEPTALQAVMAHSKVKAKCPGATQATPSPNSKSLPKFTANDLSVIMADVAEEMCTHHGKDCVGRMHLDILKIQGASRFFGMAAVGQRLGVLVKVDVESPPKKRQRIQSSDDGQNLITLGLRGERFRVVRTTTQPAQELIRHADIISRELGWHSLMQNLQDPAADGQEVISEISAVLDDLHAKLGGWANVSGKYVCEHIKRKFIMLLTTHFQFRNDINGPAQWPQSFPKNLDVMLHAAPDAKDLLQAQLPSFAKGRHTWGLICGLGCPPLSLTLWLCFYGYVVKKKPRLLQWLEEVDKSPGPHFYNNTPSTTLGNLMGKMF